MTLAPTATYPYVDEAGEVLYEVLRFVGSDGRKDFRQRRPDGNGGWDWKLGGTRRVLYRLPDVLAAVAEGREVWIVEGEKDAETLRALGLCATTTPQGAGKFHRVLDAPDVLAGAHVVVCVDDDEPGHRHGREVIRLIGQTVASWQVARSTTAKDVTDHLAAGGDLDELEVLASSTGDRSWLEEDQAEDDDDAALDALMAPGGDAIFDEPDSIPALWGEDTEVLWAEGEPTMICAPPGIGKTTLAQQLVLGLVGLQAEVLGLPVSQRTDRRILYLAMDRPRQIRRSFRRMVHPGHRALLNERLTIRSGPMPADLTSDPTMLVQLARRAGANVVIVDSLKDAAVKLTDDEAGGKVQRAIQLAVAAGIDVLVLHHQRKGQNGEKPKRLEDVYGSVWLTAGMGSVVLLWGTAGELIVELIHLKQPADAVGPWKIAFDRDAGTVTIHRGFDPLLFLRNAGSRGATANEAAVAMFERSTPTDAERKRAKRKLDRLVTNGLATVEEAERGGDGGTRPARYRASSGTSADTVGATPHPTPQVV